MQKPKLLFWLAILFFSLANLHVSCESQSKNKIENSQIEIPQIQVQGGIEKIGQEAPQRPGERGGQLEILLLA